MSTLFFHFDVTGLAVSPLDMSMKYDIVIAPSNWPSKTHNTVIVLWSKRDHEREHLFEKKHI